MAYRIFLSPSNQTGNKYAYGDTNEAVECGKMAAAAEAALKRCGFEVKTMQWESMQARCNESQAWGADLHIPIHTNAYNKNVTGTRTMVYAKTGERYEAAKAIHNRLAPVSPGTSENISEQPQLYECRKPDNVPSVYLEVDFHDVPKIAKWLIENSVAVGEAICRGVCDYFKVKYVEPVAAPEAPEKTDDVFTKQAEHWDTAKAGDYKVSPNEGLWLRVGPGSDHKAIELLPAGTVVRCAGGYTGDWLRVEVPGCRVGFCHSNYLTK